MKKLILFLFLLFLFSGNLLAQQLSFRFANPRIIRISTVDHLQFDVQVKCDQAGKFLWAGQVKLNFNNSTFNNTATNWAVTPIGAFSGLNSSGIAVKYSILKTITGSVYNIGLLGDPNVKGNGPSTADFAEIPTDWTTMITVSARLLDPSGDALAGIDFLESGMDGFQQYISGPDVIENKFTDPNLFDSHDFMTAYTGRFFSTSKGWSQVGGETNNDQYSNWVTPVSTTVWEGNATIPDGSLSNAKDLRIENPATLTIPVTGQLTVTGKTDIATTSGLTIESGPNGTGSLITGSAIGAGSAVVQRWMTAGAWHIVSSPVTGQTVSSFLAANGNVPLKGGVRGMMDYDPAGNRWNAFFVDATSGNLGAGKGFSMRVDATDAAVTFTGSLQAGTLLASASEGLWDCIGNPFTSAIGITSGSTTTDNFVTLNAGNFESLNGAIYVWNKPDASNGNSGNYTAINNTTPPYSYLQQGQAFMVKRKAGAPTFSFTPGMQIHNPAFELKSSKNPWPTVRLAATFNSQVSTTVIAFNNAMTKGIDITYDAGLLKGGSDLVIYSGMVEDNEIALAIQALPDNDLNSMSIPVGIDFKTGGDVVFSAELLNVPAEYKIMLEDKLTKSFTNLSKEVYKVAISSNSLISDRFQLHTSNIVSETGNESIAGKLIAYTIKNIEIHVVGKVSNNAVATLYDVMGRVMTIEKLKEGSLNVIPTPNLKIGIYMLSVKDNDKLQTFKLMIRD